MSETAKTSRRELTRRKVYAYVMMLQDEVDKADKRFCKLSDETPEDTAEIKLASEDLTTVRNALDNSLCFLQKMFEMLFELERHTGRVIGVMSYGVLED